MRSLIVLVLIAGAVWYLFFRKSLNKSSKKQDEELMVECFECGTYVSSKEVFYEDGKCFCSKKCLRKSHKE